MRSGRRSTKIMSTLVLAILMVAAGCSSSTKAANKVSATKAATLPPFVDVLIADLTGTTASFGVPILDGAKVAAAQINAKGGILGHKVEVQSFNDPNNDPTAAINDLQNVLSSGRQISLIDPGLTTAVGQALMPSITQHNLLAIASFASPKLNDPTKYPDLFLEAAQSDQNVPPFAALAQQKGFHKVAMLYVDDASGQGVYAAYKQALAQDNISVIAAGFPASALDITPELESLRSQHPDALVISSLGAQTLYIFKNRAAIGWTDTPAYGDQGTSSTPLSSKLSASDLTNVFVETQSHDLDGNQALMGPNMAKFIQDMNAMGFSKDLTTVSAATAALQYDALQLANAAANQAHSIDPVQMAKALEQLHQPKPPLPWVYLGSSGQLGCYCFSTTNHRSTVGGSYFSYVHPGSLSTGGYYQPMS